MSWKIKQIGKKPKLSKVIFIEGLPGIGNVGKVAVDFIIDTLPASVPSIAYSLEASSFLSL